MAEATDVRESPKRPTDPLKAYIVVFAALSVFIGILYLKMSSEKSDYEKANAESPLLFGEDAGASSVARDQPTTTVYGLGLDILKYLETFRASKIKPDEGGGIPSKVIQDRLESLNLAFRTTSGEQRQKNSRGHYEETSITYNLEPATIERFAKVLYNIEGTSTSLRVLDISWTLRVPKENPYPPGDAIQNASFRVGFRKPLIER